MPDRIEFEFTKPSNAALGPRSEASPMHILLMGDFSGRGLNSGAQKQTTISTRKLHRVDLDNLGQVLGRIAPEITLSLDTGLSTTLAFSEMDDFHPDSLFNAVPLFNELRELRSRLHSSKTYQAAAAQLRTLLSSQTSATSATESATAVVGADGVENDTATFERLLGGTADSAGAVEKTTQSAVARLITEAVREHVVPEADAGQQVYFDAADRALGDLMRQILHSPDFQALEALWRSIDFLISRLELNEYLQLSLLDISKGELIEDVKQAGAELEQVELYHFLVEQGVQVPGTDPWSLIIGQYCFDNCEDDTLLLSALGNIAAHAGGPFLAQADASLLGCDSLSQSPSPRDWNDVEGNARERWEALRADPVATWIGLVLPRMLLRLPYGPDTDEIESFTFAEVTEVSRQNQFLWCNGAVGSAALIGQAFTERGWQMSLDDVLDIGDLPTYHYLTDGEQQLLPCAEVYLTETAADKILAQGLMPLVSLRNSNTIRLLRFQSIANPAASLSGAWA